MTVGEMSADEMTCYLEGREKKIVPKKNLFW